MLLPPGPQGCGLVAATEASKSLTDPGVFNGRSQKETKGAVSWRLLFVHDTESQYKQSIGIY